MALERRGPDCGVTMDEMTLKSQGGHRLDVVSEESRDGILRSLGVNKRFPVDAVVCPECGLVRAYADLSE